MSKRSEKEIIEDILKGDTNLFQELYESHKDLVYNVCCKYVNDKDEAKDVSQDIFIKVFNSLNTFKSESKFSTWLYRICVNHCLNYLRKKKSVNLLSLDVIWDKFNQFKDTFEDKSLDLDCIIENKECSRLISEALDSLPPNQKTAIILNKFEDLPYNEIASIMNCSVSSVESLLFRAKQNLAKKLLKYFK